MLSLLWGLVAEIIILAILTVGIVGLLIFFIRLVLGGIT